jgi:hypothetical protein
MKKKELNKFKFFDFFIKFKLIYIELRLFILLI